MPTTPTQKLILSSLAVLLVLTGAYLFFARKASAPSVSITDQSTTATTTTSATSTPSTPRDSLILNTPDFKKPIAFSNSISASVRAELNSELAQVQKALDKNPLDIKAWIDLGAIRKMGGDYAGAREAWIWVQTILPENVTAAYNLGDLYMNYLHDNAKAEEAFLLVIKRQPSNVNAYANLFTLYHYTLKNDTKAAAILEQGLKANPNNNYLLGLKEDLQ